eukprot:3020456-Prymnesium_polylepis.1
MKTKAACGCGREGQRGWVGPGREGEGGRAGSITPASPHMCTHTHASACLVPSARNTHARIH